MNETITITEQITGRKLMLDSEDYELIASYVREQDRLETAFDVLGVCLSSSDFRLINFEEYIRTNEEKLKNFSIDLADIISEGSGNKQRDCVDNLKNTEKLGLYNVISNKGTIDEQTDQVILSKEMADNIKELNMFLVTCDNDYIDPKHISSIKYISSYDE